MRHFIGIFCLLTIASCSRSKPKNPENMLVIAKEIHERVITIDTHDDINVANFTDSTNYSQNLDTQVNLPKMIEGGLDVAWFIVYTGQDSLDERGYTKAKANAMAKFKAIHKLCDDIAPDQIGLALTSEDVRTISATGRKVAMIGVENAYPMGDDLSSFEAYYNMGARYISLAHNGHSQFCDSHTGEENDEWLHNGLSEMGKEAVYEMNRLGIMIDVSHVSINSMKDIIDLSEAPIIASHSSARALCEHSRNLTDEQLQLIKANGGVVQTVALDTYVNKEKKEERDLFFANIFPDIADSLGLKWYDASEYKNLSDEQKDEYQLNRKIVAKQAYALYDDKAGTPSGVEVADFIDHVDYMVNLIGIDHVGISSDFDGGGGIQGWNDASETFNITLELVKRGYTEEEISKLWGENLLRVLDEVQIFALKNKS
ncbi:dipeptidase [Eudoraea sp.]|uniref:dipeptidase n=1 Tax=Eudoraea sp. TaxID=1979955 RepID=UPI003C753E36